MNELTFVSSVHQSRELRDPSARFLGTDGPQPLLARPYPVGPQVCVPSSSDDHFLSVSRSRDPLSKRDMLRSNWLATRPASDSISSVGICRHSFSRRFTSAKIASRA